MSERENSPQDEKRVNDEKKLRKREKKLRERLREAERAQTDALERLRQADARMRRRMAHVQELEDRLSSVRQRLGALQAPRSTIITMITAGTEVLAPLLEAPSSPQKPVLYQVDKTLSETSTENVIDTSPSSTVENFEDEGDVGSAQMGEAEPQYLDRFSAIHVIEESVVEENISKVAEWQEVEEAREVFSDREDEVTLEVPVDDVVVRARQARVVAEAAEEAARDAIERVAEAEEYLEQLGSARHLMQELERLHAEAGKATVVAGEAEEAACAVERLLNSPQEEERQEIAVIIDIERTEPTSEMDIDDIASSSEPGEHPSPLEIAQVEEIEEEEENLETVTAMIIADAAGIAAARAEAVAEACSARTREARALALKADQALEAVRMAIRKQKLSGEGADVALKAAEREATHAHAVLADAEVAEERAMNAAMNAEAEAEVAEGMAFAASSRDERDEKRRENASVQSASYNTAHTSGAEQDGDDDDDEDTLEVPVIRPQER